MLEGVKASPPECKFSKGTEKVKNIGLKVKIIKNTPNVKSRKPLKNKENRVLGGSRLICLVIRLGFEPKTHSLEGCCSIQLSYRTIVIRMGSHVRLFFRIRLCDFRLSGLHSLRILMWKV